VQRLLSIDVRRRTFGPGQIPVLDTLASKVGPAPGPKVDQSVAFNCMDHDLQAAAIDSRELEVPTRSRRPTPPVSLPRRSLSVRGRRSPWSR